MTVRGNTHHSRRNKDKEYHFFLFRHCVRSTPLEIDLHLSSLLPTSLDAYVDEPLPNWNVPENWCTEHGMELAQQAGNFLWSHINGDNRNSRNGEKRIRFHFISDASHRDIDTAYQLSQGIQEAATNTTTYPDSRLGDINSLMVDKFLFQPETEELSCDVSDIDKTKIEERVQERLKIVPPPSDVLDAMRLLERIAGNGNGTLWKIPSNISIADSSDDGTIRFSGAAALLKRYAQIIFYSRAGGIQPPFAPRATTTTKDVYDLVAWTHYTRSILNINHPSTARKGAVLADALLSALQRGDYQNHGLHDDENEHDAIVTVLMGHDGDLDSLATALNVRWDFSPAYQSGVSHLDDDGDESLKYEYLPTPPMMGIHIKWDGVTLDFEAWMPVYSDSAPNEPWKAASFDKQDYFKIVPLIFLNEDVDGDGTSAPPLTLIDLERRVQHIGKQHGSLACFQAASNKRRGRSNEGGHNGRGKSLSNRCVPVAYAAQVLVLVLLILCCFAGLMTFSLRKRKTWRKVSETEMDGIHLDVGVT